MTKILTVALSIFMVSAANGQNSADFLRADAFDGNGHQVVKAWVAPNTQLEQTVLFVEYFERKGGPLRPCVAPRTRVFAVFVTGPIDNRRSLVLPMNASCHPDFQTHDREPGKAQAWIGESTHSHLWNELFPLLQDGTRLYALQVAFSTHPNPNSTAAAWDSNWGANYPLIFK